MLCLRTPSNLVVKAINQKPAGLAEAHKRKPAKPPVQPRAREEPQKAFSMSSRKISLRSALGLKG